MDIRTQIGPSPIALEKQAFGHLQNYEGIKQVYGTLSSLW
jgi:hypothetical protein